MKSLDSNRDDEQVVLARRYMEKFLCEMKQCSIEGCNENDRFVTAKTCLSNLERLPSSPLIEKLKEMVSNFIRAGKCHYLNSYLDDRVGELHDLGTEWLCSVCGKRNRETKKKYTECITCGKAKGYLVSKKLQQLNYHGHIDPTPHLTNATKDESLMIQNICNNHREKWTGKEGMKSMIVSTKIDYEALERNSIKAEIDDVLSSIRQSLDTV
jgi:hypothetical protein